MTRLTSFRILLAASAIIGVAHPQSPAPAFDVASVKPVPPTGGDYRANLGTAVHGEVTLTNATLSECLRFAFGINNDFQIAGPDWIKSRQVRFHIIGKSSPGTPVPELRRMLQTFLIERFKMELHREPRELPSLALVVGRTGTKMQKSREDSDPAGNLSIMGRIVSNRMTMADLTTLLSRFLRQPVVDMTGLEGPYAVRLQWRPENALPVSMPEGAPDLAATPSVFAAVQEQLGMSLDRRKGMLEVIVVDRADRVPVEN